ncbi:MAG: hypothetical protein PWP23_2950 [Candidatus Sumerlaeota bacterium]|nr:hypothetical protein [Candidatus Sumerlaeota bacterium]
MRIIVLHTGAPRAGDCRPLDPLSLAIAAIAAWGSWLALLIFW